MHLRKMIASLVQLAGSLGLLVNWLHPETVQMLLMSWLDIQAGKTGIRVNAHAHPVQRSVAIAHPQWHWPAHFSPEKQ